MNELGIIINKNGEYLAFGTWVPRNNKNINDNSHWHDDSFRYDVCSTEWFQNLGIPFDSSKGVTGQLDILAQNGLICIINIKNEENCVDSTAIQITAPENITEEQSSTMDCLKEKLTNWTKDNTSFIDLIDENGEYTDNFNNINDYYEHLENNKNKSR